MADYIPGQLSSLFIGGSNVGEATPTAAPPAAESKQSKKSKKDRKKSAAADTTNTQSTLADLFNSSVSDVVTVH